MDARQTTKQAQPVGVCHGPRCRDYGGRALIAELQANGIAAEVVSCQSLCPSPPVVRLADRCLHRATLETVIARR